MGEAIAIAVGWGVGVLGTVGITGTVATVVSSALVGAVVGAAIGGISAAVLGGDIGKGMLYGAIGGAVTGGIGGYISATAPITTTATNTGLAAGQAGPAAPIGSTISGGVTVVPNGANLAGNVGAGGAGLSSGTTQIIGQTLSGVAEGVLGKPEGIDYNKQAAAQMAVSQQQLDAQAMENALQRKASMAQLEKQLASTDVNTAAQLAEQRRQYDVSATAAAARQRDAATGRGVLTIGQGMEATAAYDPALQNVLDNKLYTNVAGA